MSSTDVSHETESEILLDEGDHDRFSHYARKADIVESAVTGKPIVASVSYTHLTLPTIYSV